MGSRTKVTGEEVAEVSDCGPGARDASLWPSNQSGEITRPCQACPLTRRERDLCVREKVKIREGLNNFGQNIIT